VLALHRDDQTRDGRLSLLAGAFGGTVAAVVVRGWSRAGVDRR
jgi:hypothetical protein